MKKKEKKSNKDKSKINKKLVKQQKKYEKKLKKKSKENMFEKVFKVNGKFNFISLIKNILLPLAGGALIGFLTRNGMEVYNTMKKPVFTPPSIVFPIVWTILYTLMGISAYLVANGNAAPIDKAKAIAIYTYKLAVNFLWSIFFFNFEWYLFSFVWIILLWILVFLMIRSFFRISKLAAYLNIPYLLWITFAAYLNFGIWFLNR